MAVLSYLIAICLTALCVASSFVSFAAYEVSGKKALLYLMVFSIAYAIEQSLILYNEYSTQNLPFDPEWGAMEDPFSHIVLGVLLCQSLWLLALDFANEKNRLVKYGPTIVLAVASLAFYTAPGMDNSVRKWVLYTLRQFFLLGIVVYFWMKYLSVDTEVERLQYSRKSPMVSIFAALVALIILEDAAVMLFMGKPDLDDVFLTEFLYRRNLVEIILSLCIVGYAFRLSMDVLKLKRETGHSPNEEPQQRRIHDALPYFAKRYELSSREEEILAYMLEGHGNQHIASELQVAVGTVKTHTHHIFKKTGVSNRPELFEKFWSEV